jgi:outer membrane protein assembly factor BamE (lipoprotein component of BamABCDE complex)
MRTQLLSGLCLLVCLGWVLAACTPTVANRGAVLEEDKLTLLKPNSSTRETVLAVLGTPSSRGSFDDTVWYYIGRRTEQQAFFDPEVVEQHIVTIRFTPEGVVKTIEQTGKDAVQDIAAATEETPSFGTGTTWLQDLFGNVGRAGLPTGKLQR